MDFYMQFSRNGTRRFCFTSKFSVEIAFVELFKNVQIYVFRSYKTYILLVFTVWTSLSILLIPHITVGLDQEQSMATDSHVYTYFKVK